MGRHPPGPVPAPRPRPQAAKPSGGAGHHRTCMSSGRLDGGGHVVALQRAPTHSASFRALGRAPSLVILQCTAPFKCHGARASLEGASPIPWPTERPSAHHRCIGGTCSRPNSTSLGQGHVMLPSSGRQVVDILGGGSAVIVANARTASLGRLEGLRTVGCLWPLQDFLCRRRQILGVGMATLGCRLPRGTSHSEPRQ